jgi:hypothetical protein
MATVRTPTTISVTSSAGANIQLAKAPTVTAGNVMRLTLSSGAFEDITQQSAQELITALRNFASTGKLPL